MKIAYIKQTDLKDCGVSCLMSIVRYYGGYVRREYLREITNTTDLGVSVYSMVEAASLLGFDAKAIRGDINNIREDVPFIAHTLIDYKIGHFVVVIKVFDNYILVMDPNQGYKKYKKEEWSNISTSVYILYKPKRNILKQDKELNFFKIFVPIIKKYKSSIIIVLIFSLLSTFLSIMISYGFKFFLEGKINYLKSILFILISIVILREIIKLFRNNLINYINHSLDKSLINEVYNHIIRLPYLNIKSRSKGDIVTRIQDVFKIREVISQLFGTLSIDIVFVVITLIFLFKLNIKLSLIIILISIIYLLIVIIYNKIIISGIKTLKKDESIVNNHLIESLSSIETIKNMQIENYQDDKLLFKYTNLQNSSYLINKKFYKENFLKEILIGIGSVMIIYFGILFVNNGDLKLSYLLVFWTLMNYYFEPIQNICNLHLTYLDSKLSFIRIKELLSIDNEKFTIDKKSIDKHILGNIVIKDLIYSYNGINNILKCSNLNIKANDKVLLYGTSGSGKSTLMRLIVRYFNNYKGEITIDNRELSTYNLLDIRNKITYLSQDEIIYTDTIYNNIILKNNLSYEKYLEIINLTNVSDIINRSILKDEMILENSGSFLSGGEKQRILIARALARNSDIYIFDESFSAIDLKSERKLLERIFKYLKNKTVIVISHRFNNRDLYQKYVMIKNGEVYEY